MKDTNVFSEEINLIQSTSIRNMVIYFLGKYVPEYFWSVPASSTGHYHPSSSNGEGGLIRHTKSVVKLACYLSELKIFNGADDFNHDLVVAGSILHDSFKYGTTKGDYTTRLHPDIAGEQLLDHSAELHQITGITDHDIIAVSRIIKSHSGQWNSNPDTGEEDLPYPCNSMEMVVHLADYLASRPDVTVGGTSQ